MKKSLTTLLAFSILATFFLMSCEKEKMHDHHTDNPTPNDTTTINIISPKAGKDYDNGDSVYVSVSFNSDTTLYGYRLVIRDRLTKDVKYTVYSKTQFTSYTFADYWVNNVMAHTDMEFIATTYIGSLSDSLSKKIEFHAHL